MRLGLTPGQIRKYKALSPESKARFRKGLTSGSLPRKRAPTRKVQGPKPSKRQVGYGKAVQSLSPSDRKKLGKHKQAFMKKDALKQASFNKRLRKSQKRPGLLKRVFRRRK